MIRLRVHSGPRAGHEIVTAAPVIQIGRDASRSDLVLEDEGVSGRHCLLQRSPRGAYVLEDAGSKNGTTVNGQRIVGMGRPLAVYLAAGDRFQVGSTEIEVRDGSARLVFVGGPHAGREVPLDERLVSIGRAPDNSIELPDDAVSAYHGVIRCTPLGFLLEDHGSSNGTFVNDHRVQSHVLADGDAIQIGSVELRYLVDTPPQPRLDAVTLPEAAQQHLFASLVFVAGPETGRSVLVGDQQVVFGRREDCTVTVSDIQVSGVHCAVTRDGSDYWATDLRSSNGTYVNGNRLAPSSRLAAGDLLQFGSCVAELQATGGIAPDAGLTALTTVMAQGAYQVASQPKFVIGSEVVSAARVVIGRSPTCDLRLDGLGVSKHHCSIAWKEAHGVTPLDTVSRSGGDRSGGEDGFHLEDSSTHGTYVNDRRVVSEKLASGHVIRIGIHLISVTVRGERCTLELIDAATALAAVEVARESAVKLENVVPDPANVGGAAASAYKTVFKLDLPDTEALVRERKAKFKQGAPAWRPSTDIRPERVGLVAISSAALSAIAVAAVLVVNGSAEAFLNHPLSDSHSSRLFADQASTAGVEGCAACHDAGEGAPAEKCVACHAGFQSSLRAGHRDLEADGCAGCHAEHRGAPRRLPDGAPSLLGAGQRCSAPGCHPDQHSAEFLLQGPPPPQRIEAGPVPTFALAQAEFHAAHAEVKQGDKTIAIGCTSCHASAGQGGALAEAPAGKSCFRCHQGGQEFVNAQCSSCHRDEHQGATHLARLPDGDPGLAAAMAAPAAGRSLGLGGALAVAAFLPLVAVSLVRLARRRRRAEVLVGELRAHPVEMVKRLVHSINADKCVGCALCVQACPTSVLELIDHKSRVVNFDACIQCKKCEDACAFDALRMHDADKPPPMVQMPEVDRYYQTPVAGMYLIGQAAGTPQVKNAVNLGRAVVQHMVGEGLRPGAGKAQGGQVDVVIVGSGPGGLSAALTCIESGLQYVLLEKQRASAWTVRNYYHKGKPVMAEPHDVELVGPLPHWDTTREELLQAWDKAVAERKVNIAYQQNAVDVKQQGALLAVSTSDPQDKPAATWTGARVVLAIGTMGNPRKLGCPGDDLEKVKNALVDPDEFRGRDILIVGGTDSAIEVVVALCEHNRVWLSCRGAKFDRVKPKNLKRIEQVIAAGQCQARFATAVAQVTERTVVLESKQDGTREELPNDAVFAMIGGHPPVKWLQQIGVPYVDKPHSWSPPRTDDLVKGR
jgi:thioredoxin reductase (NADPH)